MKQSIFCGNHNVCMVFHVTVQTKTFIATITRVKSEKYDVTIVVKNATIAGRAISKYVTENIHLVSQKRLEKVSCTLRKTCQRFDRINSKPEST